MATGGTGVFPGGAEGVEKLLSNEFEGFAKGELPAGDDGSNPRTILLLAQFAFAKACLSFDKKDAEEALSRCWKAEEIARTFQPSAVGGFFTSMLGGDGKDESSVNVRQLEAQIIQADCYTMGALMQLMLGSYVKGAWNLSTGWGLYKTVHEQLQSSPDSVPASLHCLIRFGVGLFNLTVSLLPPTYLKVAELVGFSGNREAAMEMLNSSHSSGHFWSPFSGLLLLFFYTQLCPVLGLHNADNIRKAEEVFAVHGPSHPNSGLFLWMEAGVHKLKADHKKSNEVLSKALEVSVQFPALCSAINGDVVWASILDKDYTRCSEVAASLAETGPSTSFRGARLAQSALAKLARGDTPDEVFPILETSKAILKEAPAGSTQHYIFGCIEAIVPAISADPSSASHKAIRVMVEMLVLFDFHQFLAQDAIASVLPIIDVDETSDRLSFVLASLLAHSGDTAKAKELALKTKEASDPAFLKPFSYYLISTLVDNPEEATAALKEALGSPSGYALETVFQFRIHGAMQQHQ